MHSFRHSMRDRLREINCPSEIIDEIGGWSNQNIGNKYGLGFKLLQKFEWVKKI